MTAPPMPEVWPTVVHMLADAAARAPETTALVCGGEAITYREYWACVSDLARELNTLGIGAGDRVVLLMQNSVDAAVAMFAVQAAGAQVVPLNPAHTVAELRPVLADANAAAIFHDTDIDPLVQDPGATRTIAVGAGARRLTAGRDLPPAVLALPDPDSLSTLQYTGGTTGIPKGASLSHRAIAVNVSQREALLPTLPDRERVLTITPLFHVYAVSMGLYLAAYCRGTLFVMRRFQPLEVLETIEREAITFLSASPTIFLGLMRHEAFVSADLRSLRVCSSGSAALPEETLRRWEEATGCPICEGYGQTEAGPVLTFNPLGGPRKPGRVGLPVPGTVIEIVDPETGLHPLDLGEIGEIRAKGPQIMSGYRNRPEQTAEALRDGWLHTGDIGSLDVDGHLQICDRKKDMVVTGGYNVFPREVEDALLAHPNVVDAAVVGAPDDYRGEALVAFVVARGTPLSGEELLAHLAGRLTKYKWPREFRFVADLPKTAVGKIDKKRLRAASSEERARPS